MRDYIIIEAVTVGELEDRVSEILNDSKSRLVCLGGVSVIYTGDGDFVYYQAMGECV